MTIRLFDKHSNGNPAIGTTAVIGIGAVINICSAIGAMCAVADRQDGIEIDYCVNAHS